MKKDKRNSRETDDIDSLIKAMNYELAGEIGVISPEDMNRNKQVPKTEIKRGRKDSNLKKKR
ncbi:hypothetical protein [Tissierella creatinophila]|uniref:Uncharacterized protein n=1 Tax=Tissierella creatinophila DSM 6911 TaxID=1123403 RepID=A0A1U7M5Q1_TISCR|nr:hypothetical protein [Tissierella creatinophila]OLS02637.1 hypothetical protein TICRE_14380 [Tissierella creatinophila DSM 6911]